MSTIGHKKGVELETIQETAAGVAATALPASNKRAINAKIRRKKSHFKELATFVLGVFEAP